MLDASILIMVASGTFAAALLLWAVFRDPPPRGPSMFERVSPNAWWRIDLEGGKVRNILIPRDKDPVAYLATWIRLNPDERPIGATNTEDGTYIDMRIAR